MSRVIRFFAPNSPVVTERCGWDVSDLVRTLE